MPMKFLLAGLAWLPVAASGQQTIQSADPADPRAAAPALRYESAFKDYRSAAEEESTPDVAWRSVNDNVKGLGGHAGHIRKGENVTAPASRAPEPSQNKHH